MRFSDIKGNDAAIAALRSMVDEGRVPHAFLFYENPGNGALPLAVAFLQYLFCKDRHDGDSCGECPSCRQISSMMHPDVHYVFPVNTGTAIKGDHPVSAMGLNEFRELFKSKPYFTEPDLYEALGVEGKAGNISVFEAKDILDKLSLSAVCGGYRAVPLFLPERMNVQCANKLLKLLEEPPAQTIFILVTNNPDAVLKTISSRCQFMRILPADRSMLVPEAPSEEITGIWNAMLGALLRKDLLAALQCVDSLDALKSREKQKAFCIFAVEHLRKTFLVEKSLDDIAYLSDAYAQTLEQATKVLNTKYIMRAVTAFDRASMLIGRNVGAKMVFTDLVNRLYVNL